MKRSKENRMWLRLHLGRFKRKFQRQRFFDICTIPRSQR